MAGGRTWYYAISAVDEHHQESALSFTVKAAVPPGSNSNSVVLTGLSLSPRTASFHVYRGVTPLQLFRIASHVAVAKEFTDTGFEAMPQPPADENFDHARVYWRWELIPEHQAVIRSQVTIGNPDLRMIADEHVGMVVRITRGRGAGQERVIAGNSPTVMALARPWDVEPDSNSAFVVSESSWRLGAVTADSPARFALAQRSGATVQISARSVNHRGMESPIELSPFGRHRLAESDEQVADTDLPPTPVFGLRPNGQGIVDLMGIGFANLANTRTIEAGVFTLHYFDELKNPTPYRLEGGVGPTDTVISMNLTGPAVQGSMIQIDGEILVVETVHLQSRSYTVARGAFGTEPESHASQTQVFHLESRSHVVPFAKDFFGTPASGSYSYPIYLPAVKIAAAELYVRNMHGNSESAKRNLTSTVDYGIRTLSGGQLSIQVEGALAVEEYAAPPLILENTHVVRDVFAMLRQPPTGSAVVLELVNDGEPYCTLTIPPGATVSNVVSGLGKLPLREKSEVNLHIRAIGWTGDSVPAGDLTVIVRL